MSINNKDEFPEQTNPPFDLSEPHGWIQWKGTDVCIDIHCVCGEHSHYDGDFLYHFKCPVCNVVYQVGAYVKLYKLDFEPEFTKSLELGC